MEFEKRKTHTQKEREGEERMRGSFGGREERRANYYCLLQHKDLGIRSSLVDQSLTHTCCVRVSVIATAIE